MQAHRERVNVRWATLQQPQPSKYLSTEKLVERSTIAFPGTSIYNAIHTFFSTIAANTHKTERSLHQHQQINHTCTEKKINLLDISLLRICLATANATTLQNYPAWMDEPPQPKSGFVSPQAFTVLAKRWTTSITRLPER